MSKTLALWRIYSYSPDHGTSLDEISRRRMPDKETLSDTNVLLISEWLSTCSTLHTECRHKSDPHLPTRVIDVGPADCSQIPHLIITSKEIGDYVALSHCWGSSMKSDTGRYARILRTNLEDMQRGIPLDELPQNFKDAIRTVRKLQLRFLWIDALCIVQDDPADWAREAARMNDVYGSAYLTIAATSTGSSTDGFLKRPQEIVSSIPCYKEASVEPAGRLLVAYMRMGGDQGSWFSSIETARWNTRGWTFQERLLSRRILHFTERKFFWECHATDTSEENEPPRDPRYRTSWLEIEDIDKPSSLIEQDTEPWESSRFDMWYSIVSRYTCSGPFVQGTRLTLSRFSVRELSCETDVLPALSGLAHAFGLIYKIETSTDGNEYLAGLWREDLARGLLWAPHDSSRTRRSTHFVAPTWSWASIKGKVHFPSRSSRTSLRFVSANLELKAEDRLGAIVAANIILLARLRCLSQVVERPESSWYPLDLRIEGVTVGKGAFDMRSEDTGALWMMECMLQQPMDFRDHPTLLLLRSSGNLCDTYERVGVGRIDEDFLGCFGDCEPRKVIMI